MSPSLWSDYTGKYFTLSHDLCRPSVQTKIIIRAIFSVVMTPHFSINRTDKLLVCSTMQKFTCVSQTTWLCHMFCACLEIRKRAQLGVRMHLLLSMCTWHCHCEKQQRSWDLMCLWNRNKLISFGRAIIGASETNQSEELSYSSLETKQSTSQRWQKKTY